jgi:two-component system, LytTR family, sensor kinase
MTTSFAGDELEKVIKSRTVLHVMFWASVIVGYILVQPFLLHDFVIVNNLVRISAKFMLISLMCYANLYWLWPTFAKARKWSYIYVVLLVLLNGCTAYLLFLLETSMTEQPNLYRDFRYKWYYFGTQFISNFWFVGSTMALHLARQYFLTKFQMSRIQIENLKSEIKYLTEQINPHFLFNALNNIYVQIDRSNRSARETVAIFSELLRYQLYECSTEHVSLLQEFKYLQDYIALQKMRKSDRLQVSFSFPELQRDLRIPPLLFVGFIENAFKFVSNYKEKENFIYVHFAIINQELIFQTTNSFEPSGNINIANNHHGLGLKNIKRRLELQFPKKHELLIQNTNGVFSIQLKVKLS